MPRRPKSLSESDREVWARYTQAVAPLEGVAPLPPPARDIAGAPASAVAPPVSSPAVARPAPPLEVGLSPGGIDRATWARFRSGKLPPARTLDLHGMTLQRAHSSLHAFLAQARAERIRCVEVITGRGREGAGAIRREFASWLNDPALRGGVLAASHPHPANTGSVRLLLRRTRERG